MITSLLHVEAGSKLSAPAVQRIRPHEEGLSPVSTPFMLVLMIGVSTSQVTRKLPAPMLGGATLRGGRSGSLRQSHVGDAVLRKEMPDEE